MSARKGGKRKVTFSSRPPSIHSYNEDSGRSSSTSEDFLTRPYSPNPSDEEASNASAETGDEQSEDSTSGETSIIPRRKQTTPKRRKDNALKEIMKLQNSTNFLIPRLPFQRYVRQTTNHNTKCFGDLAFFFFLHFILNIDFYLFVSLFGANHFIACSVVHEIIHKYAPGMRLQSLALDCFRESAESYIVQLYEDAWLCCLHRGRVTLQVKDARLALAIRGMQDPGRKVI